ncbi:MAG TPA: AAA family ATPase, partial [Chthonomonadaceae bacterium]|nr:AAA family ATPase [Chthonomonadaceae bacterium]
MSEPFHITIPDFSMVVLIGASGSGKSTFAATHFKPSEVLSSDAFRLLVSDDENDQSATTDAFAALHFVADLRLRSRRLVVIDATNVQPEARKPLLALAQRHDCLAVAIVLDVAEAVCQARNRDRADRQFGPHVVSGHIRNLRRSLRSLKREGFRYTYILREREISHAAVGRTPTWTDRRAERGPFDVIGDVHGCCDELIGLLEKLGYVPDDPNGVWRHPEGRRAVFLGDLVDRGPKVVETVRLVMAMAGAGAALCVPGNHDVKFVRALKGNPVSLTYGLAESLQQVEALPEEERGAFREQAIAFLDGLVSHLWLDDGRLCAAHAGMKAEYIGRASARVREFALYGDTTGETDDSGLPIRYPWAEDYRGPVTVVYGHTPVDAPQWLNNTINIDTSCVFGGSLTALRWPERDIVQVPARATYHARTARATPAFDGSEDGPTEPAATTPASGDASSPPETE